MSRAARTVAFALLLGCGGVLHAGLAEDMALFAKANRAYKTGDYEAASKAYHELTRRIANPSLFLNLGNAHYKSGRIGAAILAWERGLKLEPDDSDLAANLRYARDRIVDRSGDDTSGLAGTVYSVYRSVDLDALLIVAMLAGWALLISLLAVYRHDVTIGGALGALLSWFEAPPGVKLAALFLPAGCLLALAGGWAGARIHEDSLPSAIVLEKEVKATSGPGADPTVVFAIHEGTRVTVLRRSERWAQISLANGYSGWVPEGAIEAIGRPGAD